MKHDSPYMLERRKRMLGITAPVAKPKKKGITKKSSKMKVQLKDYNKIKDVMLKENNRCEIKVPGICTKIAEGLHHKKRRGVNLLDKKYLVRACNACNTYLENDPQYALDHGFSISVHKVEKV